MITKGKKITVEDVHNYLSAKGIKAKEYDSLAYMVELNDALLAGRSVFAHCFKYPSGSYDRGRHYYSLFYVNEQGIICKFWLTCLMDKQNIYKNEPKYCFYSGAIGMSRLLDATDGLFCHLKAISGTYEQISTCL